MVQRLYSFLVVFLLIFSGEIFGQENLVGFNTTKPSYSSGYKKIRHIQVIPFIRSISIYDSDKPSPNFISLKIVPASFSSGNLGFFCKKELQLDKVTAIPVRFRLGSLAYVNYMEQKPNAIKPQ
jgi:hypothetical protein